MKKLPRKPSKLLTIALEDMGRARRSKKYRLYMHSWHAPMENGPCLVCLAGAVLAFTLDHGSEVAADWGGSEDKNADQIFAINRFRTGEVAYAFAPLSINITPEKARILQATWHPTMEIPENNYRRSVYYWRRFIKKLKELGH